MKNVKKAITLILSLVVILAFTNFSLASTITAKNETEDSNNTVNKTEEPTNELENNTLNNTNGGLTTNTPKTINSSNATENLPNTGIDSNEINLALIVLLALVFCMFSLIQYNKIVKKDNE